jgi:phosphate:Na+ symporter
MDNIVDRLTEAIKLYIARLTRGSLDEREGRRAMETVSFAINLSMSAISSTRICAS